MCAAVAAVGQITALRSFKDWTAVAESLQSFNGCWFVSYRIHLLKPLQDPGSSASYHVGALRGLPLDFHRSMGCSYPN